MTATMKQRVYTAGITVCTIIYSIGGAVLGFWTSYAICDGGAGTTTTSSGEGIVTTVTKGGNQIPWDDLRKSVETNSVIVFFSFIVISLLAGLVLYFARSKSADQVRHEGIVKDMQTVLIDCVTKNTIALDKLISKLDDEHDLLKTHPCLILDSKHRGDVLKVINGETE